VGGATATAALAARSGSAQTIIPDKAIRVAVGFRANTGPQLIASSLAAAFERRIGRHTAVEGRPSPAGTGAVLYSLKAPADGLTVAVMPSFSPSARLLVPGYGVDTTRDTTCVGVVGSYQAAIAVPASIGVSTLKEYVDWVKANEPDRNQVAITGLEVFLQVYGKYVCRELGLKPNVVQPESMGALFAAMNEGKVSACCGVVSALLEHHRSGKLRILMTSGENRVGVLPRVPTAREAGLLGLTLNEWHGLYIRSATPPGLMEEWKALSSRAIADPNVAMDLRQLGVDPVTFGPEDVPAQAEAHYTGWQKRMTAVGMQPCRRHARLKAIASSLLVFGPGKAGWVGARDRQARGESDRPGARSPIPLAYRQALSAASRGRRPAARSRTAYECLRATTVHCKHDRTMARCTGRCEQLPVHPRCRNW